MERCHPVCKPFTTMFCPECKKARPEDLKRVRLMGAIGVAHSSSPAIEQFWATGDPSCL